MKITRMTKIVSINTINPNGVLFGGQLMYWMDEASGVAAYRYAGHTVVTAAVENIRFLKPIPMGAFVEVTAEVVSVGNTSMKIQVQVFMDGETEEEEILVADAMFIYVAVDKNGKKRKINHSS